MREKIPGPGGLPANTTGRMVCLLSGGFDSAVAAYKMMRRGAHVSFVHFWGGGARPGESSVHVARALVERLVPYQFTAKLYLVPFEADPAGDRARRAGKLPFAALSPHDAANRRARGAQETCAGHHRRRQPRARWLRRRCKTWWRWARHRPCRFSGRSPATTSRRSWPSARRIGTFDISAEPFHDCCRILLPRSPALYASRGDLDQAEAGLDVPELVNWG